VNKKRVTIKISGEVQGVFFRVSTQKQARQLNLTGSVSNEIDDTVLIIAEGEEDQLKKLVEWCQNGPAHAKVNKVGVEWSMPKDEYQDFSINY